MPPKRRTPPRSASASTPRRAASAEDAARGSLQPQPANGDACVGVVDSESTLSGGGGASSTPWRFAASGAAARTALVGDAVSCMYAYTAGLRMMGQTDGTPEPERRTAEAEQNKAAESSDEDEPLKSTVKGEGP